MIVTWGDGIPSHKNQAGHLPKLPIIGLFCLTDRSSAARTVAVRSLPLVRRYNTLDFASKAVCQRAALPPLDSPANRVLASLLDDPAQAAA